MPLALALSWLIRWAAPGVAAHLPALGLLALRDYSVLAVVCHRWWLSACQRGLGAFSHVLWDHVTHASIAGTSLGLPALHEQTSPLGDTLASATTIGSPGCTTSTCARTARLAGVGRALMAAVSQWARQRVRYLEWQAHEERAAPFYERLGYHGDPCPHPEYPTFEIDFRAAPGSGTTVQAIPPPAPSR